MSDGETYENNEENRLSDQEIAETSEVLTFKPVISNVKGRPSRPSTGRKKTSAIWNNFTIVDKDQRLASCDLCGTVMSFRSTVTNIRKHLIRKHNLNDRTDTYFRPATFKPRPNVKKQLGERIVNAPRKKTLTELGGLDGLLLNVVADEGEDPLGEEETPQDEVVEDDGVLFATEVHDYCATDSEQQSDHPGDSVLSQKRNVKSRTHDARSQSRFSISEMNEKVKKNRIMDLQLECLEIKKYTMQMEALMLEHQLNLPRSVYTETLEKAGSVTRGTQTDIGGNNTKVFYVSDSEGARLNSQHFFSFQARTDE